MSANLPGVNEPFMFSSNDANATVHRANPHCFGNGYTLARAPHPTLGILSRNHALDRHHRLEGSPG